MPRESCLLRPGGTVVGAAGLETPRYPEPLPLLVHNVPALRQAGRAMLQLAAWPVPRHKKCALFNRRSIQKS